jgi:hypothetical protein
MSGKPSARVRKFVAAGALAMGLLLTIGVGHANADHIQVDGSYDSQAACQADGPEVEVVNGANWTHFACVQHSDGVWYLYLSN